MKVSITGGSGHVGSNLCRILLEQGYEVKVLSHIDDSGFRGLTVETVKGDVLDPDSLNELVKDAEVVFHLAARISISKRDKKDLFKVNVDGTRNVIAACKQQHVKRFIHFSSIHALNHSPVDKPMDEHRHLVENSPILYETTKAKGEKLVREAYPNNLEVIIINPTAIIGPYDFKPSLLGQALIRIYKNTLPGLVPGGYDWVDVRDVCQAAVAAIHKGKPGESYIVSGNWKSLKELSEKVHEVTGRKTPQRMMSPLLTKIGLPFIQLYAMIMNDQPLYTRESLDILEAGNQIISHSKASEELGYSPRPLEDTIRDTVGWFEENGYL